MYLHFLRAIGTAMSMRAGIAADAAAALLFRILSLPSLLFPLLRHSIGVGIHHGTLGSLSSCYRKQVVKQSDQTESQALEATIEATAQGIASLFCAHGPEVEWRICTIWEAAYGLISLSSSSIDLPEIVVATPLQPPVLSWNLYLPLLKVLEYLPRGGPAEACLMRIFFSTVAAILRRTFPLQSARENTKRSRVAHYRIGSNFKNLAVAEFRTMVHSLFVESNASPDLASRLLFVVLAGCISHEALPKGTKGTSSGQSVGSPSLDAVPEDQQVANEEQPDQADKKKGPVAAFDSYVLAAVCALACELQLFSLISQNNIPSSSKGTLNMAKINGAHSDLRNGVYPAVCHTRRFLGILEALFSLKPSSVAASWSYGSNEIVAAAMVGAHVSELFRRSKPCMHALSLLMRCKWDKEIFNKASSLYHLIDIHGKTIASIMDKAEPLEAHVLHVPDRRKVSNVCCKVRRQSKRSNVDTSKEDRASFSSKRKDVTVVEESLMFETARLLTNAMLSESGRTAKDLPVDALDLANFLTMDGYAGFSCKAQILLRSVLVEKQELCFSMVSLLWCNLIGAPEMQMNVEGTSAQKGWRQVVDALCNVVLASPVKASTAVVLQANKDLQPWIAKDDEESQKICRINRRIVSLLAELLRIPDIPEALMIIASASDILLRATDGMLVDGEACTLPQLELLEATAKAVELVFNLGDSGLAIAAGLSNLLKCRLTATVRCLSHPSAHVRALSTSLLRDILHIDSLKSYPMLEDVRGIPVPPCPKLAIGSINWHADLEQCIAWEIQSRHTAGLTLAWFSAAAKELGCALPH